MADIDNTQDIMDSRDVIARIDELTGERDALQEAVDEAQEEYDSYLDGLTDDEDPDDDEEGRELADTLAGARKDLSEWNMGDDAEELRTLKAFAADLESYGDWEHGETLIRESYFTEYAEELASDIGAIDPNAGWPLQHIDWDAAADALKQDYTEAELDGVTYYMRA
ncbi:antirestriction protein [Citromicrobium phage vB_CbaS-RXM]|nr:antirestriction protein [Citromicrobium phage vB_CbaS-RXM]